MNKIILLKKQHSEEVYVAEEDPTLLTETTDTEVVDEKPESSGGLFSAIGSLFGSKDKEIETELIQEEPQVMKEEMLVAKVDETEPVIEEIELAQTAEKDVTQYSVEAGRRALTNSNYDAAVKQFRPLAEAGDSEAQAHLGSLYYTGSGVEQNYDSAFNWYKKAADQGNVDAQYSIGNMYLLGEGVEQNNDVAATWYTLASEQGHVAALNNLENLKKLDAIKRQNQLKEEVAAAQEIVEEISDETVIEENIVDSSMTTGGEEYDAAEDPTLLSETTDAESAEKNQESSGGLFSAIGNLFGSKDKEIETELIKEEPQVMQDEMLVAKVDETEPVIEEIELAQTAEQDVTQYSVEAGRRALANNNYDEVVKQFRPLAEAGNSEAQAHLGSLYYVGKGCRTKY